MSSDCQLNKSSSADSVDSSSRRPDGSRKKRGPAEFPGCPLKAEEARALEAFRARQKNAKPLPDQIFKVSSAGVLEIGDIHPDPAIGLRLAMEALGVTRLAELHALLHQVANLTQIAQEPSENGINQMLAQIAAVGPKDGVETMLAAQMVAVHNTAMAVAGQLRRTKTIPQQNSNGNLVNRLARTFATQVEALKRYRTGGQQKVTVEHVTVNEGGQAIVGNVEAGGGGAR